MIYFVLIFIILVIGLIGYFIPVYNRLIALKHAITKTWSNIDILLKQRHDELPKLVEVCKQYMQYEGPTLEKIIAARSAVAKARDEQNVPALGQAETGLRIGLGQLFAVAEQYPDLKANENFQHLEQRISLLESSIADRRESYNDAVNQNNVSIEQFPDVIVSSLFSFKAAELLKFSEQETVDVDIKQLFNQP